ncbi:MAG TPA: triose-phosphate isomerase [SAR324 cluster bacterium]|nr:triose-phosphate isomerase [SAR324 cluster bacterium]
MGKMRKPLIAGNWKMNGSIGLAADLLQAMQPGVEESSVEVVICPPFSLLQSMGECFRETSVSLGAQNVHPQISGAYTGETSAAMLNEMEVKWCIVGHSERRVQFAETDALVRQKVGTLLQHGIQPIVCVGESLEEREAGKHESVVVEQLKNGLSGLAADDQLRCTIAYEPVWAIGTGKTATSQQANSMHLTIRRELAELATEQVASEIRILYGGSVNAANAAELLEQSEIDGALVGGASLKTDQFPGIIAASNV